MATELIAWVHQAGFTHVELLPVMEHPFYGSWGYQTTGYFAPTARYGTPDQFMDFIDRLHGAGIGVILDWVPSHFPTDAHGLARFDGTPLYEHADPREGFHPDWQTLIFNYGRHEVKSFLLSSARFWLDVYHADALRVDAVASMLYRDYSRAAGEWIPNQHGGRENLEAIAWLRQMNTDLYAECPGTETIAEESTAWPGVSQPVHDGGLGFGFKWDMGWMHDTLAYFTMDPVYRRHHHQALTFRMIYGFQENFVLPLSHDEVVHGKGSLVGKMPGDDWRKLAQLRMLLAYQWLLPGKKLLFMGGEFGQWAEWNHDQSLDWHLVDQPEHRGIARLVADLNRLYRAEASLGATDHQPDTFRWVVADDASQSVYAWLRTAPGSRPVLAVMNATPMPRFGYPLNVPLAGGWQELLNTDADTYGGTNLGNWGAVTASAPPFPGGAPRLDLTLPPLGLVVLAPLADPA
jgi:1,4-alpha-glucan branching enzyme